jgi:hypothetical protein
MISGNRGPSARVAICEAQRRLVERGYSADRVVSSSGLYDLVAWRNGHILLVAVKAARVLGRPDFSEHVVALSGLLRRNPDSHRKAEMWVYRRSDWMQWEITPGGAIRREVAA